MYTHGVVMAAFVGFAFLFPRFADSFFRPIETIVTQLARKQGVAILSVALTAIFLRLALLWYVPVPYPKVPDEFSYLLAADTFAHGRLTNPPHPMWKFFETFHVLQLPSYMSKYPPAQGAFLAFGQLLGNPWIGVILSTAAMYAAILWMLQGWMPPQWALLGVILMLFRMGIFNYWVDSYWGGAVAALGGALVLGAFPRLLRRQRPRDALMLALGAGILANSRPYEGFIFSLPVAFALIWWFLAPSPHISWRAKALRIAAPAALLLALILAFDGYYNWRVTGNPLELPYTAYTQQYDTLPLFVWQKIGPAKHYLNPQFDETYNHWTDHASAPRMLDGNWRTPVRYVRETVSNIEAFFFRQEFLAAFILALPWLLRERKMRLPLAQLAFCTLGFSATAWSFSHYIAPVAATAFLLITQSFRHVRRFAFANRPVGIGLTRALVLIALARLCAQTVAVDERTPYTPGETLVRFQPAVTDQLEALPGQQLIVVRYTPHHDPSEEWIHNRADIDRAKVVWARELPGTDIQPLLDYFRARQVWLLEPDIIPPRLSRYPGASPP